MRSGIARWTFAAVTPAAVTLVALLVMVSPLLALPPVNVAGGSVWQITQPLEGGPPEPVAPVASPPGSSVPIEGMPPEPQGAIEDVQPHTPPEPTEQKPIQPEPAPSQPPPAPILLRDFLVIRSLDRFARTPLQQDVIESMLVSGQWKTPKEGDPITGSRGVMRRWERVQAGDDGWLRDRVYRSGYGSTTFVAEEEAVYLLHAQGHSTVFVNGQPRAGDPYDTGWMRLPVRMHKGENELLFHLGRGQVRAELTPIQSAAQLATDDATLPDLIVDEDGPKWGAVWVVNAANTPLRGASLVASHQYGESMTSSVGTLPPLSVRKVPFEIDGGTHSDANEVALMLRLLGERTQQVATDAGDASGELLAETTLKLRSVQPSSRHVRTFVSEIDGSVQYYAVRPSNSRRDGQRAMILSLHGAGVQARRQAGQYSRKSWAHVVAPTNRRPFGFDWEDWGRLDALEVMELAQQRYDTDPQKTYLTGHSMGGHGTWLIGAMYPGRFAALGPSAGWISFNTYAGTPREPDGPIEQLLSRASSVSDTLQMKQNLASAGIYVLHGEKDENVPVGQARQMRSELAKYHTDFAYFEQPGAGHWWGSQSCDWPAMMQFFQHHDLVPQADVKRVDFTTLSPGVSATTRWLSIEAQQKQFMPSRAVVDCDAQARRFVGTTDNVARMALDVSHVEPNGPVRIEMDGRRLPDVKWPSLTRTVWLEKVGSIWRSTERPSPRLKGPHRYGTFKDAFDNRAVLVYGTRGSEEENAWSLAKARYDAETFLYRGNGALDVIADREFDPQAFKDRNVVLYGNADTNYAWPLLLSTCPIQVRNDGVSMNTRNELGDNLACLFVYPRPGSNTATVGVISGTGLAGMKLTNRLRYFVSGVAYPDVTLISSDVLIDGTRGIHMVGFFGLDWRLESGEFEFRDLAL